MEKSHNEGMTEHLNRDVQAAWNANAAFWDEHMGEGNALQTLLVGPATERLLQPRPDELVLDIACGNGHFARRLADLGARVVAVDFSEQLLEHAHRRTLRQADRIEYRLLEATDEAQLLALGRSRFDAAACTMALMDMAEIGPLARALAQLLKPPGRFVFSVLHPCFHSSDARLIVEEANRAGELVREGAVKVSQYIFPWVERGLAFRGQPTPHFYFNRPLSLLLGTFFQTGFVTDALEEPVFNDVACSNDPLNWRNFKEIPEVLVARLHLSGSFRNAVLTKISSSAHQARYR